PAVQQHPLPRPGIDPGRDAHDDGHPGHRVPAHPAVLHPRPGRDRHRQVTPTPGGPAPFRVALTFDVEHHDRPATADATQTLLGLLAGLELGPPSSIQGLRAEASPATPASISAAGHLVGNHSYYHARMPLLTDAGLVEDLT